MTEDDIQQRLLQWRNVDDPCQRCHGSGVRTYGNTSTWRGGIGGATMTNDVCDQCWGSGDRYRQGVDLKKLRSEEHVRVAEAAVDALARSVEATLSSTRADVMRIVEILRREANKRNSTIWFSTLAESLAKLLETAARGREVS